MIIPNLETSLKYELKNATEVYIAVALIKDYGLNFIESHLSATCKRKYLLGIDLPTAPTVLRTLLDKKMNGIDVFTKLYNGVTYHPKVYIIEKDDGQLVAFIGSANATRGGMSRNKEMSFMLTDQTECKQLCDWFQELFQEAKDFDKNFVAEYEKTYRKNKAYKSTEQSNLNDLLKRPNVMSGVANGVSNEQYFNQFDYDALAPMYHTDDSDSAKTLRETVRNKLYALDQVIYPQFRGYGINDLHRHYMYHLTTSLHYRVRYKKNNLDAIWLHYGKKETELGEGGFTDSCRMQVIIRNATDKAYVGIWLFVGKPWGSQSDRENLKNKLADDDYTNLLYKYFLDLGDSYAIEIGDEGESASTTLIDACSFRDFLLMDDYSSYFIIGREYHPNDPDISEENIEETVLVEFSKLYKLYKMIVTP